MTAPTPSCPVCSGRQIPNHPGGVLYILHKPTCELLAAEDATGAADADRLVRRGRFIRPVTAAEAVLMAALGYSLPTDAVTVVDSLTPCVRSRTWPTAVPTTPVTVSP